jgi:DNA polymerase-3 subunit gamma/tau
MTVAGSSMSAAPSSAPVQSAASGASSRESTAASHFQNQAPTANRPETRRATSPFTSEAPKPVERSFAGASAAGAASFAPVTPAAAASAPVAAQQPAGPVSWEGFIEFVRKPRPLLASILEHGSCTSLPTASSDQTLQVAYQPKDSYFRDQLQSRVYNEQLLTLTKEYFGKTTRVQLEIREAGESLAEKKRRELEEKQKTARDAARNHPTIVEAKALFGGELGPIELSESLLAEQEAKE